MGLIPGLALSASGLQAQKIRMDLNSANLANSQTTRGPNGEAYKKIIPIFEAVSIDFNSAMHDQMGLDLQKVEMVAIEKDSTPLKRVYDPGHPDSDKEGFVEMPNVDLVTEMAEMLLATRAYEANVTAFNTSKNMALKLLDLGKS